MLLLISTTYQISEAEYVFLYQYFDDVFIKYNRFFNNKTIQPLIFFEFLYAIFTDIFF